MRQFYVGVDTGGTFTDLVAMDDTGTVVTAKTPTMFFVPPANAQ